MGWREVVLPKEHGSWSLALEPVALGLIAAPSAAGGWFAVAATAGFLARRPLKSVVREAAGPRREAARRALAGLTVVAVGGLGGALAGGAVSGVAWLLWLAPTVALGGVFAAFDLKNAWRSEIAEIAGAAAFAWLSAVLAAAAGAEGRVAAVLGVAMVARAVPTVMMVRAAVRGAKTGEWRTAPALAAAGLALAGGGALWWNGLAPATLVGALGILLARSVVLLRFARLRARTLGIVELCMGIGYVGAVGAAWNLLPKP